MTDIAVHPLTSERWDDFATLFGPRGACADCWCTYFRLPAKLRNSQSGADRRAFMHDRVVDGPPPGLLGYRGSEAVFWMQIGPRADVPQWNTPRRVSRPLGDAPANDPTVWAISCLFAKRTERGKGLSRVMVAAGIRYACDHGARILEACSMDPSAQSTPATLYVGPTSVFAKAGFRKVAERRPGRPLMRLQLIN